MKGFIDGCGAGEIDGGIPGTGGFPGGDPFGIGGDPFGIGGNPFGIGGDPFGIDGDPGTFGMGEAPGIGSTEPPGGKVPGAGDSPRATLAEEKFAQVYRVVFA